MSFLLDTNVVIHLRDNQALLADRIKGLASAPSISAGTRVELEGGVYADPVRLSRRRLAVDALLQTIAVIDFTEAMAAIYGEIVARSGFSRRKIIDRMIAATALVSDLTLITANGTDFADIPDLKLESWDL